MPICPKAAFKSGMLQRGTYKLRVQMQRTVAANASGPLAVFPLPATRRVLVVVANRAEYVFDGTTSYCCSDFVLLL